MTGIRRVKINGDAIAARLGDRVLAELNQSGVLFDGSCQYRPASSLGEASIPHFLEFTFHVGDKLGFAPYGAQYRIGVAEYCQTLDRPPPSLVDELFYGFMIGDSPFISSLMEDRVVKTVVKRFRQAILPVYAETLIYSIDAKGRSFSMKSCQVEVLAVDRAAGNATVRFLEEAEENNFAVVSIHHLKPVKPAERS